MGIACVIMAGGILGYTYLKDVRENGVFIGSTVINGIHMEGMTPAQAADELLKEAEEISIAINEDSVSLLDGKLIDYGYDVDEDKFISEMNDVFSSQSVNIVEALKASSYETAVTKEIPFIFDEDTFDKAVSIDALSVERYPGYDAHLVFDEKNKGYYIQEKLDGNEFDDLMLKLLDYNLNNEDRKSVV